jgi:pimeloyl-ACP methyl ester carboxylesterase
MPKIPNSARSNTTPKSPRQAPRYAPAGNSAPPEMIDLVDPSWILKALGGILLFAVLCSYLALCFLYTHGQWQLVLHPTHTVAATPASLNLPFTQVHFGVDSTGQPEIDGWFIPAATSSEAAGATTNNTALLLHSGEGDSSDALPAALTLHDAHLNVLLFDYRGYGHSLGDHPTQASMQTDADTALTYLTTTRALPISSVVVYGTGAGASIAVHLCATYPNLPALLLQSPDGDFEQRVRKDPRSRIIPISLLFNQNFPLSKPLQTLTTPRLLLPTNPATLSQFLTKHLQTTR